MEKVTNEMLDSLKHALPYLIMSQGPWGMLMIMFISPVISLVRYLWTKFRRQTGAKYTEILTHKTSKDVHNRNLTYFRVVWYVKEVVGTGERVKYESSGSSNAGWRDDGCVAVPDYNIYEIDGELKIPFKGTTITLNHYINYDEGETIRYELHLGATNEKTIREFIELCGNDYNMMWEQISSQRKRSVRYIYEAGLDERWIGTPCRIMKTFDNVFMEDGTRTQLIDDINEWVASEELYKRDGIPYKRGYLLYGPPGTGKSSIWHAISTQYNLDIYRLNITTARSRSDFKRMCFDIPKKSLVVVDDIDRVKVVTSGVDRGNNMFEDDDDGNPSLRQSEVDKQLLLEVFDGYDCFNGCIVVFTSNDVSKIDPAMIRAGRIDLKIEVTYPSYQVIGDVFRYFYGDCPVNEEDIVDSKVSTSELINTAILPNRKNMELAYRVFLELVSKSLIDAVGDESKYTTDITAEACAALL